MLLLARHLKTLLAATISEAVPSVLAEVELGNILQRQKGVVAGYMLDNGNPRRLERLHGFQTQFKDQIALIRETTHVSAEEAEILDKLEKTYAELVARRDEAAALYQSGQADKAKRLLVEQVNDRLYNEAHELCQELIAANDRDLEELSAETSARIRLANWIVGVSLTLTIGLGVVLLAMFFYGVLVPLRGMVADVRLLRSGPPESDSASGEEELRAVRNCLRSLMTDVADTRSRMLNAEKLALVGRLAAGVAHEIRNPLTAMKMWLFSARETAQGNPELDRKLGIVSDEMSRLDRIIRNFLEFSRPRALDRQSQDMAAIIDQTLELLVAAVEADGRPSRPYGTVRPAPRAGRLRATQTGSAQPDSERGGGNEGPGPDSDCEFGGDRRRWPADGRGARPRQRPRHTG